MRTQRITIVALACACCILIALAVSIYTGQSNEASAQGVNAHKAGPGAPPAVPLPAATHTDPPKMLTLGATAPGFALLDVVTGGQVSSARYADKKLMLVIITCRHCPYVKHIQDGLVQFGKDYGDKDIAIIGISANDPTAYPEDAPEKLKELVKTSGLSFPLLYDASQETAKAFTAVCTPEFFLFDKQRKLIYRGQFDDARPGKDIPVTGKDLRAAVDAALKDQPVSPDQKKAIGCSIKWRKGNRPAYAK